MDVGLGHELRLLQRCPVGRTLLRDPLRGQSNLKSVNCRLGPLVFLGWPGDSESLELVSALQAKLERVAWTWNQFAPINKLDPVGQLAGEDTVQYYKEHWTVDVWRILMMHELPTGQ